MKGKRKLVGQPLSINRLIALVFAGLILVGTLLLMLPIASRDGKSCGWMIALFTATSSTCVTGLSLVDTWTQWSGFGQAVLLTLIEIGGLGFMSVASIFIFAFRKKISLQQRRVIAQSIGAEGLGGIAAIQKELLLLCLGTQAAGALVLTLRFCREYSFGKAIWMGVFHAVSAFCNAGFDILGFREAGSSMITYGTDPVVILTLCVMVIVGAMGYLVWHEIIHQPPRSWSVYTRLVLIATGVLLFGGAALIAWAEWQNPATLGQMKPLEKCLAAFFQSVTTRTAGFAGIDQGSLTDPGRMITIFLMFIGGSSGSTAGGLKTVTFVVLLLFIGSKIRGRDSIHVFHRTIPESQVLNALTIFGVMISLSFVGAGILCADSGVVMEDALYETVSAIATVGLTAGITTGLHTLSRLMIILFMYFGRVGVLTISLGFLQEKTAEQKIRYARSNLLIG